LTIDREMLMNGVAFMGVTLSDLQIDKFELYYDILLKWNKKINLTAITNSDEVVSKHFIDSLSSAVFFPKNSPFNIVDIGSGPGLPGVALKIAFPNMNLLLTESIGKKVRFLEHLLKKLDLTDVNLVGCRVEDIPTLYPEYVNRFDYTTARAVGRLLWLLELAHPFLKQKGEIILWKGRDQIAELPKIEKNIKMRGFEIINTVPYRIPLWNIDRFLVHLRCL
jgi:16S rRNA (guanine527-N7)-methyltransferase